ncbi:BREX system P-loop protein BrxC [Bacillus tropicus]|uniref:BREX system P-loop protein BrxC n=1 Tax=Bacillus tropicus TaxID=2026188 RepID=UPI000936FE14|nr:BREX system P-loop protein BrxC [Bacillus tropicus]MED3382666.1 BREX system P-loop protein BrxC [Bacillus tropicus]
MFIKDMFKKDIMRPIQSVIQAEQHNDDIRKTELEEFVLTTESEKQLKVFLDYFASSQVQPTVDSSVWISGFFGSGKSHFMKILGYMFENKLTDGKYPVEYLQEKTQDEGLKAFIAQAVQTNNQTITFNISAQQSVTKKEKFGIAETMYNQFNRLIGFSKYAKIAYGEHQLAEEDRFEEFCQQFEQLSGKSWETAREKVLLNIQNANKALAAIGLPDVDAKLLFNSELSITVEDIAKLFSTYAKSQGEDYRLIFLIDEISQYIGDDSELILELQTIVELVGSKGLGQVWVVVTSQKSLSDVIKDGKNDDYSKIQARFKSRINLTSSDTDEVIKKRLLEKKPEAQLRLRELYNQNRTLMQTTLAFKNDTTSLPSGYKDEEEFVSMYPLVPYEISMLQSIFEKIREQGEGGASTSKGERTILAAAQLAIQQDQNERLGNLVTMAEFYPSIEQQLDPAIVNTMEQAKDLVERGELEEPDLPVLYLLYFLRGLETTKARPELDNLAVMLIPGITSSRKETLDKIEASLHNLNRRMFASKRVDGTYEFLTSEERKANEAIKAIMVEEQEVFTNFQQKYFTEFLPTTKRTISYNNRQMGFEAYFNDVRATGKQEILKVKTWTDESGRIVTEEGTVQIHFTDKDAAEIINTIMQRLKIEKYIRNSAANTAGDYSQQIVGKKRVEMKELEEEVSRLITNALKNTIILVNDEELHQSGSFDQRREEAYKQIITKTFDKMGYITRRLDLKNYATEWKALVKQEEDGFISSQDNIQAIQNMKEFIDYSLQVASHLSVEEVVVRYTNKPFGWETMDVLAVLLTQVGQGQMKLIYNGNLLTADQSDFVPLLDKSATRERILIEPVKLANNEEIEELKKLIRRSFDGVDVVEIGASYDEIVQYVDSIVNNQFTEVLRKVNSTMQHFMNKPGCKVVIEAQTLLNEYLQKPSVESKIAWFKQRGQDTFRELQVILEDIEQFYGNERNVVIFKELEAFYSTNKSKLALDVLNQDASAQHFKSLMDSDKLPGRNLKTMEDLMKKIRQEWDEKLEIERQKADLQVKGTIQQLEQLNPTQDEEFNTVIEQGKEKLEQLKLQIASTMDSHIFNANINRARQILDDVKSEIHRMQEERNRSIGKKTVFFKSTNVMNTLFGESEQLSTEEEVNQAVDRLKVELLAKLVEGTIVREH